MNQKNITVRDFKRYLLQKGLKCIRINGSHEVWSRKELQQPVVLQSNIDPVPVFIIRNNLRTFGETVSDLEAFILKINN